MCLLMHVWVAGEVNTINEVSLMCFQLSKELIIFHVFAK